MSSHPIPLLVTLMACLVGSLTGCPLGAQPGSDAGYDDAAAGGDGGPPDGGFDGGSGWLTDTLLEITDGGVRIESVTYLSGGLTISGQVCRPDDAIAHPVIMVNHGGFSGLTTEWRGATCQGFASLGYVVGESSYRGEDTSTGSVEVCLGEVDDVQNMMSILRAQSYVDPTRFEALGASHGGCITLQLAIREPTLKAAVDFFGPSDLASLYSFWQSELAQGEPPPCPADAGSTCATIHNMLINVVDTAIGGPPSQFPTQYASRSPANSLGQLAVPLMIFQGTSDFLVDVNQACEKRAALSAAGKAPSAWYFDSSLAIQNPTTVCGGAFETASPPVSGTPGAWTQDRNYLLIFEGQGHGFAGNANTYALDAAVYFLLNHL